MTDYKSRVNQPDRLFLSSGDDVVNPLTSRFDRFEIRLATPILDAKRAQLLRATIPNALTNIPDYALCVWYYRGSTMYCVRLMPSNWVTYNAATYNMPVNSYFTSPADLVTALNLAANNDNTTLNASFGGAGDVSFTYNTTTKKISMTGANTGVYYSLAGYNSPNITSAVLAGIKVPDINYGTNSVTTQQPSIPQYNLNMRIGYAQPADQVTTSASRYVQLGGNPILMDSYPNLIYTQCFYLYASIVAGSSLGSNGSHNLLSVVPCSAAQLGVTNYTALTLNWLTKVPDNIYSVLIEMRDDNNQPVFVPDNGSVNVEIAFKYD